MEDLKKWYANDKAVPGSMGPEHCRVLCESAHSLAHEVSAVYDGPMLQLDPFEEAIVPATWGGGWIKGGPPDECMVIGRDDGDLSTRVKVLPGVCDGKDTDFILCLYNDTVDTVPLEAGMVLGYARSMPVPADMMFKIGEDSSPAAVPSAAGAA